MLTQRNLCTAALALLTAGILFQSVSIALTTLVMTFILIYFRTVSGTRDWTAIEIVVNLTIAGLMIDQLFHISHSPALAFVSCAITCSYASILVVAILLSVFRSDKKV